MEQSLNFPGGHFPGVRGGEEWSEGEIFREPNYMCKEYKMYK